MALNFLQLNRYILFLIQARRNSIKKLPKELYNILISNEHLKEEISEITQSIQKWKNKNIFFEYTNHGAKSKTVFRSRISLKKVIHCTGIKLKYGLLLFKIVRYYKPKTIVELGTSAGTSTLFMAKANPGAVIYTIDGNIPLLEIARANFKESGISNVIFVPGLFSIQLPQIIQKASKHTLFYIDGDHNLEGTIKYFNLICSVANYNTIIIFDDINWSGGMQRAWRQITKDSRLSLCIDLFFMGIVFFNPNYKKALIKFNLKI